MKCSELATQIERLQPDALPRDVARLSLLLNNAHASTDAFTQDGLLLDAWRQAGLCLQFASDQHAAMSQELDDLANLEAEGFSPEALETLLRAIRVQSQLIQLYLGQGGQPS
ncbi:MAG: hypothetical protein JSS27_00285 [Planctomycetes bacterium]|nr:hypothetical protein [Planctomycetota bacterium]